MLRAFSMTEPMPPAWTTPQTTTPTNAAIMTMACIKSEVLSAKNPPKTVYSRTNSAPAIIMEW